MTSMSVAYSAVVILVCVNICHLSQEICRKTAFKSGHFRPPWTNDWTISDGQMDRFNKRCYKVTKFHCVVWRSYFCRNDTITSIFVQPSGNVY